VAILVDILAAFGAVGLCVVIGLAIKVFDADLH
jgi:hypothetical protein